MTETARSHWDVLSPGQLAGASQTPARVTPVQNIALLILKASTTALTDEELYARYLVAVETEGAPRVTETSVRCRRHELHVAGLVRAADEKGRSRAGRPATRWEAA